MSQADVIYDNLIKHIHKYGTWNRELNVRAKYADGTSAYAKSVFGVQTEFRDGIIPALTKKKLFWKTAFKEMKLFWIDQTVKEKDFKENNVKVWDEWFIDGGLGRSYAYQFESHRHRAREIVKISPRIIKKHGDLKDILVSEIKTPNLKNKDILIGKVFKSNKCGDAIVLDTIKAGQHYQKSVGVKLQFLNTGFITIVQKQDVFRGRFVDKYARTVHGVGYKGNIESVKNYSDVELKKLEDIWNHMIARCYKSSSTRYERYGGRGIFIDERWHSLENFLRDIRYLPQFFLAKENNFEKWELDKDYYKSNCYSKDTCTWLTSSDNVLYSERNGKLFKVIEQGCKEKKFIALKQASSEYGFDVSNLAKALKGSGKIKGYHVEYINDDNTYRYELSRNQVVDLINTIKTNPGSRRLMTSFWNVADVDKKVLQECAWATEWNVRDGKLDLILIQRSGDVGLGVPFNWIQYWFLQNIISQVCGLEVGDFVHQIGNLHYYDRHEDVLLNQLNEEDYPHPQLWINPKVKCFYDFTIDDIKLIDYKHGDKIEMEVAL